MWAAQAAKMGYRWKVGNGRKIRLWEDNWLGSSSLAIQFWPLYRILNEKNKSIDELWDGRELKCTFRRSVNEELYQIWLDVVELVSILRLTNEEDEMIWLFNTSGVYSSQSLYKVINFRGIKTVHVPALWHIKIPPRVHFFLWQLINNKVLTRDNLAKRRKIEDPSCLFCSEAETVQHLFFDCVVAAQCWKVISDIVGTTVGGDLVLIGQYWLSNKRNCVLNIVTSAVFWSIWKLRNEILFQNIGWRSMDILLYRIAGILQNWEILCPVEKKDWMKLIVKKIKEVPKMILCLPGAGA
jgi:hypothetical protein